jgi:hypothetical protein
MCSEFRQVERLGLPSLTVSHNGQWNIFATLCGEYMFNAITITHAQGRYVVGANYFFKNWSVSFSVQKASEGVDVAKKNTYFQRLVFRCSCKIFAAA